MTSIALKGVSKLFGLTKAVDRVSLEVRSGELFFLLGASGCGKTTVLRLIAGFYQPDEGAIFFGDRDITGLPPQKRNTGMVFQNYALWPHLTIYENVEYGLNIRKSPDAEKKRKVEQALQTVQMWPYKNRYPNQLSGGQQQRVALARALVIEPDVLLFDEPLSNLDAKLRLEMRSEIKRIHETTGITTVYVTHDQKEALSMADRMAVMNNGRIEQIGTPKEIYHLPRTRFVGEFIGEANLIPGTIAPSTDGQNLCITTVLGTLYSNVRTQEFRVGDQVECLVRPEAIRLDQSKANILNGIIADITYLGETEQYLVKIKDHFFKVIQDNPLATTVKKGDETSISFAPDQVVLIKKEQ
jgi:iron(III) transport system ATP-binding protein